MESRKMFWDNVSYLYTCSPLTTHCANVESEILFGCIDKMDTILGIAGFGVADGKRDIIDVLDKCIDLHKYDTIDEIIINDISDKMLHIATDNLSRYTKCTKAQYICDPIENITSIQSKIDKNPTFVIGVYNANYIIESLKLYHENMDTIGKEFMISPLYIVDKHIVKSDIDISFNIDDISVDVEKIILEMKEADNFYAYSIKTEKNFVSHFFNHVTLTHILNTIYGDMHIDVCCEGRYIINVINNTKDSNYIVTMINNVLGNIVYENHMLVLKKLHDFFIK